MHLCRRRGEWYRRECFFAHGTKNLTSDIIVSHRLRLWIDFGVCKRNVKRCRLRRKHRSTHSAAIPITECRSIVSARPPNVSGTLHALQDVQKLDHRNHQAFSLSKM